MSSLPASRSILYALKRKHTQAVAAEKDRFFFDWNGERHEFMTVYAKYLIQQMENTLGLAPQKVPPEPN